MTWMLHGAGTLALAFAAWRIGRRLQFFLHLLQLEGYKPGSAGRWVAARPFDVVFRLSHAIGIALVVAAAVVDGAVAQTAVLVLWAVAFASSRRYRRDRPKKPLVATPRLRRLAVASALPAVALVAAGLAASHVLVGPLALVALLGALWTADLGAPAWALAAGSALAPVERRIHEGFKRRARRRLREREDLLVLAVTGSYGKTSVKFTIAEMLAARYAVLATPGSYNTPMGICRVVNDQLRPEHQVLVLEMGIRHAGDIEELCDIVRPDVAVITGVGIAHLETMGSEEAIASEKGSLLDFVAPGGTAVLNADDRWYDDHRARAAGPVVSVSASGNAEADLRATDIRFGPDGTRCVVHDRDGHTLPVELRLLGRHHVTNTLLGLAVARLAGVRLRQAVRAAGSLEPVPHRLALRREGDLLVLDDAFNSNPVGARNALEVLAQFPGRRFVVTPGMVELGEAEDAQNEAFGRAMADAADEVYLVGPGRTEPIARGLRTAGFPDDRLHVVNTLFEARDAVRRSARPGDVVLYENDLPDQYTEG